MTVVSMREADEDRCVVICWYFCGKITHDGDTAIFYGESRPM